MTNPQAGGGAAGTFFNAQQRATIEAAMARIIPTDDQPGAREAGTIDFLDRYLSGLDFIYAKPDGSGFEKLQGKHADAWKRRIEIIRVEICRGYQGTGSQKPIPVWCRVRATHLRAARPHPGRHGAPCAPERSGGGRGKVSPSPRSSRRTRRSILISSHC